MGDVATAKWTAFVKIHPLSLGGFKMSGIAALEAAPPEAAGEEHEVNAVAEAATPVEARAETGDEMLGESNEPTLVAEATEKEQKEAKEAKEGGGVTEELGTLAAALSQREREEAVTRIRNSTSLPPALRECLARVVEAKADAGADGKARVPIDEAVRAVEEAVPEFLRVGRSRASQSEHPAGDAFFSGEGGELTDAQAEELARGQLARSGLLRGQRVRVAD